jgi:hypothetical protein
MMQCTGCYARADALRAGCDAMRCAALHGVWIVCDAMAARGLVAFARCRRRHAFDGGIFRVGFFWDWLNVHTFNCHHRADRRVKGWLRNGWVEEWIQLYILPTSGRWSHSLPR